MAGGKTANPVVTVQYVNRSYQKNVTTGQETLSYYLGDTLVAVKEGGTLRYIHPDQMGSSSVATDVNGVTVGTLTYYPYGSTRTSSGSFGTDRKFTGQRLDGTGLFYYGARYYHAGLGRFISPDPLANPYQPQSLNRYSYVANNPLRHTDPGGAFCLDCLFDLFAVGWDIYSLARDPSSENAAYLGIDVGLAFVPIIPAMAGFAGRAAKEGGEQAAKHFLKFTQDNLRENLRRFTGKTPDEIKGLQAHHVLPPSLFDKFSKAGFTLEELSNPKFGAWVRPGKEGHQGWSSAYNKRWKGFFKAFEDQGALPSQKEILDFARQLAKEFEFDVLF